MEGELARPRLREEGCSAEGTVKALAGVYRTGSQVVLLKAGMKRAAGEWANTRLKREDLADSIKDLEHFCKYSRTQR